MKGKVISSFTRVEQMRQNVIEVISTVELMTNILRETPNVPFQLKLGELQPYEKVYFRNLHLPTFPAAKFAT